jgi:hypothetical protein
MTENAKKQVRRMIVGVFVELGKAQKELDALMKHTPDDKTLEARTKEFVYWENKLMDWKDNVESKMDAIDFEEESKFINDINGTIGRFKPGIQSI